MIYFNSDLFFKSGLLKKLFKDTGSLVPGEGHGPAILTAAPVRGWKATAIPEIGPVSALWNAATSVHLHVGLAVYS